MNRWDELKELAKKKGVKVVDYRPTPLEELQGIGRSIKTRERLEREISDAPNYTELQKKQIREQAIKMFGLDYEK